MPEFKYEMDGRQAYLVTDNLTVLSYPMNVYSEYALELVSPCCRASLVPGFEAGQTLCRSCSESGLYRGLRALPATYAYHDEAYETFSEWLNWEFDPLSVEIFGQDLFEFLRYVKPYSHLIQVESYRRQVRADLAAQGEKRGVRIVMPNG